MFDTPVDAWYVWLGVSAVSIATLAVAAGLPTAAPPDAAAAADAIDGVATGPVGSTTMYPLDADEMRLDRRQIGLRGAGGTAHASVAFGPMTPASADERLEALLGGTAPPTAFENGTAFERAATDARTNGTDWRHAPDRLVVRRVSWEGIDVLLVG